MTISKSILPINSILMTSERKYDYIDSYSGFFMDRNNNITSTETGKAFFMSGPKWIEKLFTFRNKLVGFFGLKTSGKITERQHIIDDFKAEKEEQIGLFKVFDKTQNEIVLGEDDKHLNFRVSLLIEKQDSEETKKK